jgi:hypothetical protein
MIGMFWGTKEQSHGLPSNTKQLCGKIALFALGRTISWIGHKIDAHFT